MANVAFVMGCKTIPQNNLKIIRKSGACLMRSNHSPMTKHRAFKAPITPPTVVIAVLLIHKPHSFFFLGGSKNAKSNDGHGVTCRSRLHDVAALCNEYFPGGRTGFARGKMQDRVQQDNRANFRRKLQNELCLVGWQTEGGFGRRNKSEQQRYND